MDDTAHSVRPILGDAVERGLLDLTVRLSTREITAGKQFAVFVLVKNPFARPVWIERVHVSLPSELLLADDSTRKRELEEQDKEETDRRRQAKADSDALQRSIEGLRDQLHEFNKGTETETSIEDIKREIRSLDRALVKVPTSAASLVIQQVSSIGNVRVESASPNVVIQGKEANNRAWAR